MAQQFLTVNFFYVWCEILMKMHNILIINIIYNKTTDYFSINYVMDPRLANRLQFILYYIHKKFVTPSANLHYFTTTIS